MSTENMETVALTDNDQSVNDDKQNKNEDKTVPDAVEPKEEKQKQETQTEEEPKQDENTQTDEQKSKFAAIASSFASMTTSIAQSIRSKNPLAAKKEDDDDENKESLYKHDYQSKPNWKPRKHVLNPGSISRKQKRVLVTGGAGFIGSHLVDVLMERGYDVICVDNLFSGQKCNIYKWFGHPNFEFMRHDVCNPLFVEVDEIYHLACPASPVFYQNNPIKTVKTCFIGTQNMLGLAKRVGARMLISSTSEIYGDPKVHPQKEDYWGNVNPIGIRSCYDEGKRIAETLMFEYHRQNNVNIAVARIFNTYGPRMLENDGRVVSNFIVQALSGKKLTIYGDGSQTRSFCYIDDQIRGLMSLMESGETGPINIGNPDEYTITQLAKTVTKLVNKKMNSDFTGYVYKELPSDDPKKRKPDITKARKLLNWEPKVNLEQGLSGTIDYFCDYLGLTNENDDKNNENDNNNDKNNNDNNE